MENRRFDAVIFDLDGTLLDTIDDITDALNATLHQEGYGTLTTDQAKEMVGYGGRELVRCAFLGQPMSEEDFARRIRIYKAEYGKRVTEKARLYDGIAALLDALSDSGIKMSVFSNKQDQFTQSIAKKYFSKWNFTRIAGDIAGKPLKPDPGVPLEMAKSMKTVPSKVAFIGDSETDIKTGITAGMTPIAVTWGFRSRERLESAGAAIFADNATDLACLLEVPLTGGTHV